MRIAIGSNTTNNSFGGGNQFANNLIDFLKENQHSVSTNLKNKDIDIILITEPRKYLSISSFSLIDALNYKYKINKKVKILLRVNENDQRKNTYFMNIIIRFCIKYCDHVIFISNYLNEIFKIKKDYTIIHNGANHNIFKKKEIKNNEKDLIKVVTHHWSANYQKGFDIYKYIDEKQTKENDIKICFTYIGNLPKKFKFKNSNHINPLHGNELSEELNKHDIYITASKNEPAGMHHIEAACCGLPILYYDSGALPEYCNKYGIKFNKDNLFSKIQLLYKDIDKYKETLKEYPFTSKNSNKKYLEVFNNLLKKKSFYKIKFYQLLKVYFLLNTYIFLHRLTSKILKK